ncbi:MAG: aldo/keto reductase [Chloroflexota bacterium]|nr:aldo/keto reductase [Dehalococcoidia bacterium]MDW8253294.1 aldo/keto reductase [Chloroflexota bacterium]
MHDETARVTLGREGPTLLPLGVGAFQWGDRWVWGYGRSYSAADVQDAFWTSLAAGVSLIDTAEIYGMGRSERLIGRFLRTVRVPVLVASKFFPFPWRQRELDFFRALEGSLRRLGRSQIDLYQIHWPTPLVPIERLMEWMAAAVRRGLIAQVGVSNFGYEELRRAYRALDRHGIPLASNQINFSLLARAPERTGLLDLCRELGVTVIAYSPLGQGLLTGKYSRAQRPPGVRSLSLLPRLRRIDPLLAELRRMGERYGRSPAQIALRWTIEKGTIPIPGAKTGRQAAENAGALRFRLSPEDVAALDRVADQVG